MYKTFWVTGIVRLTLLAHLLTQLFVYKAWTLNRVFPTLTVFTFARNLPDEFPFILYCATLAITLLLLWKPHWKKEVRLWFVLVVGSWAWDYVFWQPYTYCFLAIAVIHFFSK